MPAMRPEKRKKLQEEWHARGNHPCTHKKVKAGAVCTDCGSRKPKGRMKPMIENDDEPPYEGDDA